VATYQTDPWAALGDPSRRTIFERIVEQPRSVAELARELPISRPAVSQHLKVLRQADLVSVDAEGTRRIYRVNPDGLRPIRADLDRFWASTLANFKKLTEEGRT
jgi:DNA-binding transcriptional ArsR family regulator